MTRERQPLRRPLAMTAELRERGSCLLPVTVLDLSLDRCRLWAGFRLRPGHGATLAISQFAEIGASILWSSDGYAELTFDRALHPAILDHLVARHPSPDAGQGQHAANLSDRCGQVVTMAARARER